MIVRLGLYKGLTHGFIRALPKLFIVFSMGTVIRVGIGFWWYERTLRNILRLIQTPVLRVVAVFSPSRNVF